MTLSEVNNTYRTIIVLLISVSVIYLYDTFVFGLVAKFIPIVNKFILISVGFFMIILFVKSYKKQTNYIRKQVEQCRFVKHMLQSTKIIF